MALTIKCRPGADATPADLESPYGGSINMSATVTTATNYIIQALGVPSTSNTNYFTGFYFSLESANTINSARIFNRAGCQLNVSAGVVSASSTSATDVGTLLITGTVSGVPDQDTITLTGTTPAYGSVSFDAYSVIRYEYLVSSAQAIPTGNISTFVNSAQTGLVYGSLNNTTSGGVSMISAEVQFALATAKNTTISGANITVPPTSGIGSFSVPTIWSGSDSSLLVPTGLMVQNDYIWVTVEFIAYANTFPPKGGIFLMVPDITGIYS